MCLCLYNHLVPDYTYPTDNLPPRAPPSVNCRPYFVDSGVPGRGPLLGVVCADLPTNLMAIFFINIIQGDLASDDIDARAGPHRRLLIVVPRLVSASTACCRPRLPTKSTALRSDLQKRKGHEDLHVFMHDGKMWPNRWLVRIGKHQPGTDV